MIRPRKSPWLRRWFSEYNRHYLQRSFHRLHLDGDLSLLRGDGTTPLLLCVSHSSWWDLLMGLYLEELLPEWDSYAPMDERQLQRYAFFSRLGVIGVDRTSLRGAREFVEYCKELLNEQPRALWITPQGELTSTAARPIRFQPGIGCIAQALSAFYVSTVVFDYELWAEKKPEAFLSVRPLERVTVGPDFDRRVFVREMERRLERHCEELALLRQQRNPERFTTLLSKPGHISPIYDFLRGLSARRSGETALLSHEDLRTPRWREQKHRES